MPRMRGEQTQVLRLLVLKARLEFVSQLEESGRQTAWRERTPPGVQNAVSDHNDGREAYTGKRTKLAPLTHAHNVFMLTTNLSYLDRSTSLTPNFSELQIQVELDLPDRSVFKGELEIQSPERTQREKRRKSIIICESGMLLQLSGWITLEFYGLMGACDAAGTQQNRGEERQNVRSIGTQHQYEATCLKIERGIPNSKDTSFRTAGLLAHY